MEIQTAKPHFVLVGGQAAVDRIVEEFYRRMDVEPSAQVIRALHPVDLSGSKALLKRYLAEWLGGPAAYSQERGELAAHCRGSYGKLSVWAGAFAGRGAAVCDEHGAV
jgi:truncated hemoglobin YjbI